MAHNLQFSFSTTNFTVNAADTPGREEMDSKAIGAFELSIHSTTVEALHLNNKIIAHSINSYSITQVLELDPPRVSYNFLGDLFKQLFSTGVYQLSATLLISNKKVATYRTDGLLFNGNLAKPSAITRGDGNTCTDANGNVKAGEGFATLDELEKYVLKDEPNRPLMNEVKGYFPSQALVGLYFTKVSDARTQNLSYCKMLLVQAKIKKDHGFEAPIFKYIEGEGSLERVDSTQQGRFQTYMQVKDSLSNGRAIANVIAQALGDQRPF